MPGTTTSKEARRDATSPKLAFRWVESRESKKAGVTEFTSIWIQVNYCEETFKTRASTSPNIGLATFRAAHTENPQYVEPF
jgi:hypothetical protein